jgi:hypothetical protein
MSISALSILRTAPRAEEKTLDHFMFRLLSATTKSSFVLLLICLNTTVCMPFLVVGALFNLLMPLSFIQFCAKDPFRSRVARRWGRASV